MALIYQKTCRLSLPVCITACFCLALLSPNNLQAQVSLAWDGSNGGSWFIASNWTPDSVPGPLEDTTIDSGLAVVGPSVAGANSRFLTVGDVSSGALRIENGGQLTNFSATLASQAGSSGLATVSNALWDINGDTVVGAGGNATLNIEAGGVLDSAGEVRIAQNPGSVGELNIDGGTSQLIASGGVTLGDATSGGSGTLNVRNNGLLSGGAFDSLNVNAAGTVNLESGGTIAIDFLTTGPGSVLNNHSTITLNATIGILSNGGTLIGSGQQSGDLLGMGILAPNAFSPTDDTAVYTIAGNWTQQGSAELQIDLGGLFDGGANNSLTDFDRIDVSGDVSLSGALDVQLTDGFSLGFLQEFEIIDVGGTLSGEFDGLPEGGLVATLGGTNLHVSYQGGDGNDVVLFTRTSLPADFDLDEDVDADDLTEWQNAFGQNAVGDADLDNISGGTDFLIWQQQFGSSTNLSISASAVPEPSAGMLLILTLVGRCCLCSRSM